MANDFDLALETYHNARQLGYSHAEAAKLARDAVYGHTQPTEPRNPFDSLAEDLNSAFPDLGAGIGKSKGKNNIKLRRTNLYTTPDLRSTCAGQNHRSDYTDRDLPRTSPLQGYNVRDARPRHRSHGQKASTRRPRPRDETPAREQDRVDAWYVNEHRDSPREYNTCEARPRNRAPRVSTSSARTDSRRGYNVQEVHDEDRARGRNTSSRTKPHSADSRHAYNVREAVPRCYDERPRDHGRGCRDDEGRRRRPATDEDWELPAPDYFKGESGSRRGAKDTRTHSTRTAFPDKTPHPQPPPQSSHPPPRTSHTHADSRSPPHAHPRTPSTSTPTVDLYAVLGVSRTATSAELKKAHRVLSLRHHPDRVPEAQKGAATDRMARINQAFDVLGDEGGRDRYDRN